jgi:hypothetical protein
MRRLESSICVLAATLVVAGLTSAETIVVDQAGGGDVMTIEAGMALAEPGWTVEVRPGTYVENVVMTSGVVLESSNGPELTVIDGDGDTCVSCVACGSGTTVAGFTLVGGGGDVAGGVYVYDHADVEVRDCIIRDQTVTFQAAAILVQRESYAFIHHNRFLNNTAPHTGAISVIVDSSADIQDNLFRGNAASIHTSCIGVNTADANITGNVFIANESVHSGTIHAAQPGTFLNVVGNTFIANHNTAGASGVYAYLGAAASVDQNIFAMNTGMPAVRVENGSMLVTCCDFWANDADALGMDDPVGQYGNIDLDPLLCDPDDGEAAVADESPCLAAACGVIGANPVPACSGPVAIRGTTLTAIKSIFR